MTTPLALVLSTACAPPAADSASEPLPEPTPALLPAHGWAPADTDPFGDVTAPEPCDPVGFGPEGSAFEVRTDRCPNAELTQPLGQALAAGTTLGIEVWHMDLVAPEPAHGHLALRIGDDVAEIRPEIPGDAAAYTLTLTLTRDVATEEPVWLHVHNHGSNSWTLGSVTVLDGGAL